MDDFTSRPPASEEGRARAAVPGESVPAARKARASQGLAGVTEAELDRGRYHPAFAALLEQGASGGEQVDRLRRSFHELLARRGSAGREEKEEQRAGQERRDDQPPPPPLQQIVIVKRQAGPQTARRPAAFWERNGMGHFNLKAGR